MSRSSQQKLKILYLMRMFFRQTDEAHPVSMEQILSNLSSHGISAERKSVYDDIETCLLYTSDAADD